MNRDFLPGGLELIEVPVCGLGAGTGTVSIEDARTGEVFRVAVPVVTLVGATACVRLPSWGREDGLHRVGLPGGGSCWVRPHGRTPRAAA